MRTARLVMPALVMFTTAISSLASDFWVSATGSDSNPCSPRAETDPPTDPGAGYKASVQGALSCFGGTGGHRVIVKCGTYTGRSPLLGTNPPGGTASNYTVIMGDPNCLPNRPVMQGRTPVGHTEFGEYYDRGIILDTAAQNYVEVRNFEFRDLGTFGQISGAATGFRFINNKVLRTMGSAIQVAHTAEQQSNFLYKNNEFSHIGYHRPGYRPGTNTLYNVGNGTIIEGNIFHDSTSGGGVCGGGSCGGPKNRASNVTFRNNICYNMGRFDLNPWGIGASGAGCFGVVAPATNIKIYNNIIYNSGRTGFSNHPQTDINITETDNQCSPTCSSSPGIFAALAANWGATGVHIYNNTIFNLIESGSKAVYVGNTEKASTGNYVHNNVAWQAGSTPIWVEVSGNACSHNLGAPRNAYCTNTITGDPKFADAAARDFHLQSASPAIDTGLNLAAAVGSSADRDGVLRPGSGQGHWDLGAYEFTSGTPVPAPPPPAAGGFPLALQGSTLPEQSSVMINVSKPSNALDATIVMNVKDPDFPDEGTLQINGNAAIALFGSQGVAANDAGLVPSVNVSFTVPASQFVDGSNTLLFAHTATTGFVINSASVTFTTGFPLSLQGAVPEEGTVVVSAAKPAGASTATLVLTVYDADLANEGALSVNGSPQIALFPAPLAPDQRISTVTLTMPASYWVHGNNSLRFTHTATGGYRIDAARVAFAEAASMPTDVDGDGTTNVADVQLAVNQSLGLSACAAGDVNKDGACDVADIQVVVNEALGL